MQIAAEFESVFLLDSQDYMLALCCEHRSILVLGSEQATSRRAGSYCFICRTICNLWDFCDIFSSKWLGFAVFVLLLTCAIWFWLKWLQWQFLWLKLATHLMLNSSGNWYRLLIYKTWNLRQLGGLPVLIALSVWWQSHSMLTIIEFLFTFAFIVLLF